MRVLPCLLLFIVTLLGAAAINGAAAQQPPAPAATTTISGGGLPHSIRLSPIDHEAFVNRLDLPPLFDDPPEVNGPSYTVVSPYWDIGVRAGEETEPLVDAEATYYPQGGFVRARQEGEDVWTALDSRQRAILDRYIRVAASVPAKPSVFEVMRADALAGADIGITVGPVEMTPEQRVKFWENARGLQPQTFPVPANPEPIGSGPGLIWIEFSLPEGRSIPMAYSNEGGIFSAPGESLTEEIVFAVPRDWLVPVLGEQARFNPPSNPLAPVAIVQEPTQGSPLWLLLTLGGGVASIAIAVALQRKLKAMHNTAE